MSVSPARVAAFDVLLKIFRDGAYSSVLLPAAESNLNEKDRSLCHEIVLGVLRTRLKLDAVIARFSGGRSLDLEVRTAAQIGLYQILHLEKIPRYSAVNESVALVQRAKKSSAKGFVNALLRRTEQMVQGVVYADDTERLSIETSHPRWLIEKWGNDRGSESAASLAQANNLRSRSAFRLTAKGVRDGIAPDPGWQSSRFVPGCYFAERMTSGLREMSDEGQIYFQDEGSQLIGSLVAPAPGSRFLDVSAAPGSKTTLVASRAPDDAFIVAGDVRQSRVRVLKKNCENQGVNDVRLVRHDAETALPFADGEFDRVLVDAPCSGTGTIRNNPEIRYFLKRGDFDELHSKQLAILRNASKAVKRGGRLIYSTCSLEPEENEQVVAEFLSGEVDLRIAPPNIAAELLTPRGFVRTSPAKHDMDGFFAAVLERRA